MSDGDDRRLDWYRQMLQIRTFEEKVQELFMSGQIEGTTHLCQGQEAVSKPWRWAWIRRSPSRS